MGITSEVEKLTQVLEKITLKALFYYPIKSCAGKPLDVAQVGPRGILHDREFMLVDRAGDFLSQRECPRMALITPHIKIETLQLAAPGQETLEIRVVEEGERKRVTIWKETCETIDQGDQVAEWFGDFLGTPCRLVRMAQGFIRQVEQEKALRPEDQVGFADGFPFLVTSEESLEDLNWRLDEALPMNRFRPNIVLGGSGLPFCEDKLRRFSLGSLILQTVKPCARCTITTTDQATARVGKEPLRTLATFRRGPGGKVLFGQNSIHENLGQLKLGDKLKVLALN